MEEYRKFIEFIATESGKIINPYFFDADLKVDLKKDQSPVTIADREAEKTIRFHINKNYPDHGIIGEELGSENEDAEFVWVIDPVDGTRAFTAGCPLFGTLICLTQNGQPILGAIHLSLLSQLLIGDNVSSSLNGKPVKFRETTELSNSTLLSTDFAKISKIHNGQNLSKLSASVKMVRTWGDCYGYFLISTGGADIMLDAVVNSWDKMALIPIVRGAGGIITDWHGDDPVKGNSVVAANKNLHAQVIESLNK